MPLEKNPLNDACLAQILQDIDSWAENFGNQDVALRAETLSGIRSVLARGIYDQDYEKLKLIMDRIAPSATSLRKEETIKKIPLPRRQAMEVVALRNLLSSVLSIMETDNPKSAVVLIENGENILRILSGQDGQASNISTILENWSGSENPPSESDISRTLGTLEEKGFVERSHGQTRLLPKALRWCKESNV